MSHVEISRVRVRYVETDQMGIAHHGNYLAWLEIGRTDLCRTAGIAYREIEEQGFLLVVAEVQCRYRAPFRYDDEVVIHTRVEESGTRTMLFTYELRSSSGDLHATAQSRHVWVSRETRKPVTAPESFRAAFRPLVSSSPARR